MALEFKSLTAGIGRLTSKSQYQRVQSDGRSFRHSFCGIRILRNGLDISRCGYVVSKRVGSAVVRNKVRRRVREVMRQLSIEPGWDIVFIAYPGAATAGFDELKVALIKLLSKTKVIEEYERHCSSIN